MDKKDEQLLEILKENSHLTTRQIAKKTRIPITTVYHRIKKLKNDGIIKNFTINIDNKKINRPTAAYILINIDNDQLNELKLDQHDISKKLKNLENVENSDNITGGTDIILKVRMEDIDELDNFIIKTLRKIDGIGATKTMVILHEN